MGSKRISGLYYITHINNLPSIFEKGILSHTKLEEEGIPTTRIYDADIVSRRRHILTPDGKSLWNYANLYFEPRNPMLYRVLSNKTANEIIIIAVKPTILSRKDIFITTGNAAHSSSEIFPATEKGRIIPQIRKNIDIDWWTDTDGSKRTIMAECLVPVMVESEMIQTVYVASHEVKSKVREILQKSEIPIVSDPKMFFQPSKEIILTPYLSVLEGDMFFSRMQTLTVSVNCVGVMGKGLASRAKYQFPDVYVRYQDLCKGKKLKMGKPYLYKRELSFDYILAEEPATLTNANLETWFLLFPTKDHWREDSDIKGIEVGLKWVVENYKKEGIESLAVPSLGCGLGKLQWRDVGPLLCRYFSKLSIRVRVYLPAEKEIPEEQLTRDFLLTKRELF
ncbi:DUF4433 domain-containing protein [candidate division WOR-3 bacterium]|nr:DUF4433 domain-containing protein [candidate division WOR-3 bacterium]